MTGENYIRFIRGNRKDEHLEKMLEDLNNLRTEWGQEYRSDNENFSWDRLNATTDKIEKLKFYIYTYVYNRNSIEYTREFERKYLW